MGTTSLSNYSQFTSFDQNIAFTHLSLHSAFSSHEGPRLTTSPKEVIHEPDSGSQFIV